MGKHVSEIFRQIKLDSYWKGIFETHSYPILRNPVKFKFVIFIFYMIVCS